MNARIGPSLDPLLDEITSAIAERVAAKLSEHATREQPQEREPAFLSEVELARRTGISRRTLQGWRAQGRGPRFVKLGRRCLYPLPELQDLLRARSALSGSRPHGGRPAA